MGENYLEELLCKKCNTKFNTFRCFAHNRSTLHTSFSSNRHSTILSFWEGSIDITGLVLTLGTERLLWDPRGLVYWAKLKKILCYRERECWGPWPFISENMSVSVKLSFLGFQCLDLKWRLEDEKKNNWFLLFYIHPRLGHSKNSFSLVNTCWIIPLWLVLW